MSSVRSEEVADDEGNKFTVYYFRDGELDFDPNLYELAGETKRGIHSVKVFNNAADTRLVYHKNGCASIFL